jgi:hypothetical protein
MPVQGRGPVRVHVQPLKRPQSAQVSSRQPPVLRGMGSADTSRSVCQLLTTPVWVLSGSWRSSIDLHAPTRPLPLVVARTPG